MRHLTAIALLALCLATLPAPFVAPQARAAAKQTVCMGSTTTGAAAGHAFTVPVPPEQVVAMSARGFSVQPCNGKENSVPQFRKQICGIAAAPASVQASFQATYGASPSELCAMADSILGN